jgi:hypothetical protein
MASHGLAFTHPRSDIAKSDKANGLGWKTVAMHHKAKSSAVVVSTTMIAKSLSWQTFF